MKSAFRAVALVSLSLAAPLSLAAQVVDENPGDHAKFRWGGLRFTPGIAVTDVGVDNNVFNDATHQESDTTAAIGPSINMWTSLGRLRIAEKSSGQYLFFKQFDNQRSWNTSNELRLDLPLSRIKPFVAGSYVNTRQRPGFEIDSRARASTEVATVGAELRVSGKTTFVLSGSRTTMAFDQDETFFGTALAEALNRHSDTELLQMRYGLTPLTTFVLNGEATQDRFAHDGLRNSDSISVRPGFEFKPFALIAGNVSVGFRHFNVLNDAIQDYQGLVAAVDARYTLTTSTQLTATMNRDIAFSYEEKLPYYTLTNAGLTIRQRITTAWDLVARGASQTAAYRGLTAQSFEKPRTDHGAIFGLGVGYLMSETFRIGVDVNYFTRRSPLSVHSYDGLRAGASVSYGIAQ